MLQSQCLVRHALNLLAILDLTKACFFTAYLSRSFSPFCVLGKFKA